LFFHPESWSQEEINNAHRIADIVATHLNQESQRSDWLPDKVIKDIIMVNGGAEIERPTLWKEQTGWR
jgi:hypothetical protein